MDNNQKDLDIENYTCLLQQINTLMRLTLSEIRYIYESYPHCIIDYCEKGVTEKSIEIRFDKQGVTITCSFNSEGKCNIIYLYSDKRETIEKLIHYLKDKYEYSFYKKRWTVSAYYVCIKETSYSFHDVYVMFYS